MRKEFEEQITLSLKRFCESNERFKAKKLGMSTKSSQGNGELSFVFSNKGQGCYLMATATNTDFMKFVADVNSPYRPRIASGTSYFYTTLSDKHRPPPFSQNALINTPVSAIEIERICVKLQDEVIPSHARTILNCVDADARLLEDIKKMPDMFAYPFALYVYIAKKNGMKRHEIDMQELGSSKVISNKSFDVQLVNRELEQ